MKLLTINTHSLIEPNYRDKLDSFVEAVYRLRPDVIAMQEANQTQTQGIIALGDEFPVRRDNHAYEVWRHLMAMGVEYTFLWQGIKQAFGRLEEGVALLTLAPADDVRAFTISKTNDATDWRRRMALGARLGDEWFYSVHLGRYDDSTDAFSGQWRTFCRHIANGEKVWVMGDFNCDAGSDGHCEVKASGWRDAYEAADEKDAGITVRGKIDGWHDKDVKDMRIDYVFTNTDARIKSSRVIFNGVREAVVSDHFGVAVTVGE